MMIQSSDLIEVKKENKVLFSILWQFRTFWVPKTSLWQASLYRFIHRYILSLVWNYRPWLVFSCSPGNSGCLDGSSKLKTTFNTICLESSRRLKLSEILQLMIEKALCLFLCYVCDFGMYPGSAHGEHDFQWRCKIKSIIWSQPTW